MKSHTRVWGNSESLGGGALGWAALTEASLGPHNLRDWRMRWPQPSREQREETEAEKARAGGTGRTAGREVGRRKIERMAGRRNSPVSTYSNLEGDTEETIYNTKKQPTGWEKVFTNDISGKG